MLLHPFFSASVKKITLYLIKWNILNLGETDFESLI